MAGFKGTKGGKKMVGSYSAGKMGKGGKVGMVKSPASAGSMVKK